jgi:alkanesulfonate monooxygenase SsuD/methylene tetrahydromethanopterin reductase-like flavin-dependent oxidoreductase (luciferase family)
LSNQTVYPPIETGRLRTWVGVGGSPESVVRAARYGLPLTLAIIGGSPRRFRPYVDLFHQSLEQFSQTSQPVAVHSPGYVADSDEEARNELWPSRAQYEREAGPDGAICVGSPETVAQKIANTSRLLGLSRFNMKYSAGTLPHDKLLHSIELFGTRVAPRVRELMSATAIT